MASYNYKIKASNGNTTDILHPETNTGQIYDYENAKWLSELIGMLNTLSTTRKESLVASINSLRSEVNSSIRSVQSGIDSTITTSVNSSITTAINRAKSELNASIEELDEKIGAKRGIEIVDATPSQSSNSIYFRKSSTSSNAPDKPTFTELYDMVTDISEQLQGGFASKALGIHITDFGGKGDFNPDTVSGTNNNSAFSTAVAEASNNGTRTIIFTSGKYLFRSPIDARGEFKIVGIGDVELWFVGTSENIRSHNDLVVENITVKGDGISWHVNSPDSNNVAIEHSDIQTSSYGLLINIGANGKQDARILNNNVQTLGNALALNTPHPTTPYKNVIIHGNIVDTGNDENARGFGIGVAGTHNVLIGDNITKASYGEGLRIEDSIRGIIATRNIFDNCSNNGTSIRVKNQGGDMYTRPAIISHNYFKKKDNAKTGSGIWTISDENGVIDYLELQGNYIEGFNNGVWDGGGGNKLNLDGTYIKSCNVGLNLNGSSIYGTVFFNDVPTLFNANTGSTSYLESIVSTSKIVVSENMFITGSGITEIGELAYSFDVPKGTSDNNYISFIKKPVYMNGYLTIEMYPKGTSIPTFKRISKVEYTASTNTLTQTVLKERTEGAISQGALTTTTSEDTMLSFYIWTSARIEFSCKVHFKGELIY